MFSYKCKCEKVGALRETALLQCTTNKSTTMPPFGTLWCYAEFILSHYCIFSEDISYIIDFIAVSKSNYIKAYNTCKNI